MGVKGGDEEDEKADVSSAGVIDCSSPVIAALEEDELGKDGKGEDGGWRGERRMRSMRTRDRGSGGGRQRRRGAGGESGDDREKTREKSRRRLLER
jgi:hypothetical protein